MAAQCEARRLIDYGEVNWLSFPRWPEAVAMRSEYEVLKMLLAEKSPWFSTIVKRRGEFCLVRDYVRATVAEMDAARPGERERAAEVRGRPFLYDPTAGGSERAPESRVPAGQRRRTRRQAAPTAGAGAQERRAAPSRPPAAAGSAIGALPPIRWRAPPVAAARRPAEALPPLPSVRKRLSGGAAADL